tara:strand:+ start:26406 stop:28928 length:2523 start_codon:yes stop_codon:yes gene_type:complete
MCLNLGDGHDLSRWNVKIFCDETAFARRVAAKLEDVGFEVASIETRNSQSIGLKYGGATAFVRSMARLVIGDESACLPEEKAWSHSDRDIYLIIQDFEIAGKPAAERVPIEIESDCINGASELASRLIAQGFAEPKILIRDKLGAIDQFFVSADRFISEGADGAAVSLISEVTSFLDGAGVDRVKFPLRLSLVTSSHIRGIQGGDCEVKLPMAAMQAGVLPPYGIDTPERFMIQIRYDDFAAAQELRDQFLQNGFPRVELASCEDSEIRDGLRVCWPEAQNMSQVRFLAQSIFRQKLDDLGLTNETWREVDANCANTIVFYFPFKATSEGKIAQARSKPENFSVKVACTDSHLRKAIMRQLRRMGFKKVIESPERLGGTRICYGNVPVDLVEQVSKVISEASGLDFETSLRALEDAKELIIFVSDELAEKTSPDGVLETGEKNNAKSVAAQPIVEASNIDLSLAGAPVDAKRPFIVQEKDGVWIGTCWIAFKADPAHPLLPSHHTLSEFCFDQSTVETMMHLARGLEAVREPILLEGETSCSKTSCIQAFAALTKWPSIRLNMSGQTDSSDLIGRYSPQGPGSWPWVHGMVTEAMLKGYLVNLDELNLAEANVLERLNPTLERHPSMVLSECENLVIGGIGNAVHANFAITATMNPVDTYAGRAILSPAYRDRWQGFRNVRKPNREDYEAMLRCLVFGEQPAVVIEGMRYAAWTQSPSFPELSQMPQIEELLPRLAQFHVAVERAACETEGETANALGSGKRERYVYTRRALLSVLQFLSSQVVRDAKSTRRRGEKTIPQEQFTSLVRIAISRYYLEKIRDGSDRGTVSRLIEATGLAAQ